MRSVVVATIVAAVAGTTAAARAERHVHHKPAAPVTVTAVARHDGHAWWIDVEATPTRDAAAVELALPASAQVAWFPRTAPGGARRHAFPVQPRGAGEDVVVGVRVHGAFGTRTTAVTVRVGAPAPPAAAPATRTVRISGGRDVAVTRGTP